MAPSRTKVAPADCSSMWTYPKEEDGWYKAHNALRADLAALAVMLERFDSQVSAGVAIEPAQAAAATRFLGTFLKFLHHHHHSEDEIAGPYLATRFAYPDKVAADHEQLDALLERFERAARALLAARGLAEQRAALPAVQASLDELLALLPDHLREEEEQILPLMRVHFTPAEIEKHVVQKIMRSLDGDSVGTFFRSMTRAQRRAFAKQEGIPFFIRWILFRQAAKYERAVWQPFQAQCLAA